MPFIQQLKNLTSTILISVQNEKLLALFLLNRQKCDSFLHQAIKNAANLPCFLKLTLNLPQGFPVNLAMKTPRSSRKQKKGTA